MRQLDHPNIIKLLSVKASETRHLVEIAMEKCSRGSLGGLLRDRLNTYPNEGLPIDDVRMYTRQVWSLFKAFIVKMSLTHFTYCSSCMVFNTCMRVDSFIETSNPITFCWLRTMVAWPLELHMPHCSSRLGIMAPVSSWKVAQRLKLEASMEHRCIWHQVCSLISPYATSIIITPPQLCLRGLCSWRDHERFWSSIWQSRWCI